MYVFIILLIFCLLQLLSILSQWRHYNSSFFFAFLYTQGIYSQEIVNGQIYTPGIAIVDAPQPNTPLGGGEYIFNPKCQISANSLDFLQAALDVSSDGQLQLPPYPKNAVSEIYNITMFLSSYTTGKNFTISNGTATAGNASLGEIMAQEPSSTVKHVNWVWPDCLVGDGTSDKNTSRGAYNVRTQTFDLIFWSLLTGLDFYPPKLSIKWNRSVHNL